MGDNIVGSATGLGVGVNIHLLTNKGLGQIKTLPSPLLFVAEILAAGYSVETLSCSFSAACIVCHDSVAHLTRTGNSRTPEKIVRRPS